MSRVGSKIITVPDNVKVFIENGAVHAEGPKGKLSTVINNGIDVNINEKKYPVFQEKESPVTSVLGFTEKFSEQYCYWSL